MAKIWFDFGATTNGDGTSPRKPKNTLAGFTPNAGDECYFRRATAYTGQLPIVAGTSASNRTKYRAWYNIDGSDDMTKARPLFNLNAVLSTYAAQPAHVDISSLDLRCNSLPVANDSYLLYVGKDSYVTNCNIDSNIGGLASYGNTGVYLQYNTVSAVSHDNTHNNNVIGCSDVVVMDNININGNTVYHKGGGGATSHAILVACNDTTGKTITNLTMRGNNVSPVVGTPTIANLSAVGIRIQNCADAELCFNTIKGMLSGIFAIGSTGYKQRFHAHHNILQYNLNFGLHLSTQTTDCLLEYNDCSFNGTNNYSANAYGRGIELTSAAGQDSCTNHTVRFNVCNGNFNYGGAADNGSEGVGIGLDDGVNNCAVYGNICKNNEGNGVQVWGGNLNTLWSDTGGHYIVANYFENNCTASFQNRRTSGGGSAYKTNFCAHLDLRNTYGTPSILANNVMKGGQAAIWLGSGVDKGKLTVANNIFLDIPDLICSPDSVNMACYNNNAWNPNVPLVNRYALTTTDSNGQPIFPTLAFTGSNDLAVDPKLDINYRPLASSPMIGAGHYSGSYLDYSGKPFNSSTPSIGMFENIPSAAPASRL